MPKGEFSNDFKLNINSRYSELVKDSFKIILSDRLFFKTWKDVAPDKRLIVEQLADEFKITFNQTAFIVVRNQIYSQMRKGVYDSRTVVFIRDFVKGDSFEIIAKRYGVDVGIVKRACIKQKRIVKRKKGYSFSKTLSELSSDNSGGPSFDKVMPAARVTGRRGHSDYLKIMLGKKRRR